MSISTMPLSFGAPCGDGERGVDRDRTDRSSPEAPQRRTVQHTPLPNTDQTDLDLRPRPAGSGSYADALGPVDAGILPSSIDQDRADATTRRAIMLCRLSTPSTQVSGTGRLLETHRDAPKPEAGNEPGTVQGSGESAVAWLVPVRCAPPHQVVAGRRDWSP